MPWSVGVLSYIVCAFILFSVTNFAKKTGDYGSLSAVDMKVIALTYQMACEHEPEQMSKLREKPLREVHMLALCSSISCEPLTGAHIGVCQDARDGWFLQIQTESCH